MREEVSLAGRARLGIPKVDKRVETSGRCEELLPSRMGQTGRRSGARDRVTSRSAPDAKKKKHADTAAPHTQNNTKHSGVSLTYSSTSDPDPDPDPRPQPQPQPHHSSTRAVRQPHCESSPLPPAPSVPEDNPPEGLSPPRPSLGAMDTPPKH